jgi:hypothetical protein
LEEIGEGIGERIGELAGDDGLLGRSNGLSDLSDEGFGMGQVGYKMRGLRGGDGEDDLESRGSRFSNSRGELGSSERAKSGVSNGLRLL